MAYVYRHIRHDKNIPFYIGIGKTKYRHTARQNRNPIWDKISRKTTYDVEVLFEDVSWSFACQKEIELIKLYGRINKGTGTLANMTDGGDGNLGLVHSEEALKKISISSKGRPGHWKGKKMSDDFRRKISAAKKGKPNYKVRGRTVSEKAKLAVIKHSIGNKYNLGNRHSEEAKRKMSIAQMGKIAYNRKPVFQYSAEGIFIKEYSCIKEAKNITGATEICGVCLGKRRLSNGYMWRYQHEGEKILPVRPIDRRKRITQYSMSGEFIAIYRSAKEAEEITGFKAKVISRAATGERLHAYNYKWEMKYEK